MANNGVLSVAHSIFKRWRPLYRSDELYEEINHVLGKFGKPFLSLLMVSKVFSGFSSPLMLDYVVYGQVAQPEQGEQTSPKGTPRLYQSYDEAAL